MANVRLLEMSDIGWCLTIVFLAFSFDVVSGVEFLEKPENVTLDSYEKLYTLNCSVNVSTSEGIDWAAYFGARPKAEIFSSKTGIFSLPGYSVERPNNRTVNLIILAAKFQNSSVAGRYCCDSYNGAGKTACAYVTVTDVSRSPYTDEITEANHEATTNITPATSTYLSSTHGSVSKSGEIAGGVVGVCIFIALVIALPVCIFCPKCLIHRHCNRRKPSNVNPGENDPHNDSNPPEQESMMKNLYSDKKTMTSK